METIRGYVYAKFPSITAFAKSIGWERGKASRIVNGAQQPNKRDMEQMIEILEIPEKSIAPVFFWPSVHKVNLC